MKKSKKNAFTLIELIAVLVIMAIIALIATPLVMSIIRKAKIAADKRSVDAYGRSIELAIAGYLMDTGTFPTSISQLTIEYSGDEVVCSTTQLNGDSSVYLAGCTVGGRSVENYTYGSDKTPPAPTYTAYQVGDQVKYNNVDYYVIKDSDTSEESVTLLKAEPITSNEISSYLSSTEVGSKVNTSGIYATMAYYSAENCVSAGDVSGCSTDYTVSDIKQVVDIWKIKYAPEVIEARLITKEEIDKNFEVEEYDPCGGCGAKEQRITANWMYNSNYGYWTMSAKEGSVNYVWYVSDNGGLDGNYVNGGSTSRVVRPVITISKSNISS